MGNIVSPVTDLDVAVIGGGAMGCCTAYWLRNGGLNVGLFEKGALCLEASGRNAGTLTPMYPAPDVVPYTIRGIELWATAERWLGRSVGFRRMGGIEVALTEQDAEEQAAAMAPRRAAGADIEIVGGNRAREIEPAISERVVAAAYSKIDGLAQSNIVGIAFGEALRRDGVAVHENTKVDNVARAGDGFVITAGGRDYRARTLVLSAGAWMPKLARAWFGLDLPIAVRIHHMVVTERMQRIVRRVMRIHGRGSFKQAENGSFLLGGVLNWVPDPDRAAAEADPREVYNRTLRAVQNATAAVPAVAGARVVRTWTGLEAYVADNLPAIGPLPGVENAFIVGAQRSGFTTAPFMGKIVAQTILGQVPDLPMDIPALSPARMTALKLDENCIAFNSRA